MLSKNAGKKSIHKNNKKPVLQKPLNYLLQAGIVGYLFYKIYEIGLAQVVTTLPVHPFFYIIIIFIYISLPLSEIFVYRIKWKFDLSQTFFVCVKKKVINAEVLGYAGELYYIRWVKKHLDIPVDKAFSFVKDNNILSSISSTSVSIILLVFFFANGYINPFEYIPGFDRYYLYLVIVSGIIIAFFIMYKFRNNILAVSLNDGIKISTIYTSRLLITNFLQILQYAIVKPEIPLAAWFSLVAVQIISTRIPLLPSRDVLYVGVALEISELIQIPQTEIAGLLTANLLVVKLLGLIAFSLLSINGYRTNQAK